jgi:hypothetical protein
MDEDQRLAVWEGLTRFRAIVGEYAWWVRKGADDVLRLEFGSPHLVVYEPTPLAPDASRTVVDALGRRMVEPIGKWHLFVEDGDWAIVTKSGGTRRFDADRARAAAALRQLDGQKLTSVDYLHRINGWHLRFDLGGSLTITATTKASGRCSAKTEPGFRFAMTCG